MSTIAEKLRNAANVLDLVLPDEKEVLSIGIEHKQKRVCVHIYSVDEFTRIAKQTQADSLLYDNLQVSVLVDGVEWLYVADNKYEVNNIIEALQLPMRVRT